MSAAKQAGSDCNCEGASCCAAMPVVCLGGSRNDSPARPPKSQWPYFCPSEPACPSGEQQALA
eukprot:5587221-Amphidinium_carterae.1